MWAVVEKSPGFTPEGLIAEIRRNAHYPAAEWSALIVSEPVDPVDCRSRLNTAAHSGSTARHRRLTFRDPCATPGP